MARTKKSAGKEELIQKGKAAALQRAAKTSPFDSAYAALNPAQREAVDTIEGPLLVVAGPGSGKTQVVSLRVANILRRTQSRPSNILCLTYSTSGATAMRTRLRELIGPDAYGVTVTTIHGFCNDLLLQHPEVFSEFGTSEQSTDVERLRMMNSIIDDLPAGSVLVSPKDRYARTADILQRVSQMKREGLTLEDLREASALHRTAMETKSKPGTKVHARNLRSAEQFEAFIEVFAKYEERLKERELYDYEDMIRRVLVEVPREEWLLSSLHERYQYILVDEAQDLNGSQMKVVEMLSTYLSGVSQAPNVCVVGDDDQAIYRFQGANVRNMLQFRERFPDCPIVTLAVSYRSTQEILDTASKLIVNNAERLVGSIPGLTKNLRSGIVAKNGPEPVLLRPASDAVEPFVIAEKIEELISAGVRTNEIAVFTRTNRELFPIHDALRIAEIPVQLTGKLDLLHHPKVRELITILKAVSDIGSDSSLTSALACQTFQCHPADLGTINLIRRAEKTVRLVDVLSQLDVFVAKHGYALAAAEKMKDAFGLLIDLHGKLESRTLPDTLEQLLVRSGMLPRDAEVLHPLDVTALGEFFDHVKSRCHESPTYSLRELLADLAYRDAYDLRLTYAVPHIIDDGVELMTAHSAKGLEFEAVIIANFREKHWDHKRPVRGLALPEDLLFGTDEDTSNLEDERRLTYVAFTRAKRHLLLSCPHRITRGDREQDVSPSQFAVESGPLPEISAELKNQKRMGILFAKPMIIDDAFATFLKKRLETFELSVTALNTFLEDPQMFLMSDLLALPQAKTASLSYGTAVHDALREWGTWHKEGRRMSSVDFIAAFEEAITKREILTKRDREELIYAGRKSLDRYFTQRLVGNPMIYALEKKISARVNDVPIKGLIDRIDLEHAAGSHIHVIDYKTGKPKTDKQVREEYNGNLYRQLQFYRLLITKSPSMAGYDPVSFRLEFISDGDDEPATLSFTISDSEAAELQKLIERVWAKIVVLDFTPLEST
jgi:DNA helicase-2/ATP-dependent DNA helicase PcrA